MADRDARPGSGAETGSGLPGWPPSQVVWEREFDEGWWDRLLSEPELVRLRVVAARAATASSVLDVGCAQAPLWHVLRQTSWRGRYLGLDWSLTAVRSARRHGAPVVVSDAHRPAVSGPFDLVVLAEVLYYLSDPARVMRTYRALLSPEGQLHVSAYQPTARTGERDRAVLRNLTHVLDRDTSLLRLAPITNPTGHVWAQWSGSRASESGPS
jgi:2-polyprenyl-3-methyl-5-hydroxy-6-metoxy-1,4-benzoquinol methylase